MKQPHKMIQERHTLNSSRENNLFAASFTKTGFYLPLKTGKTDKTVSEEDKHRASICDIAKEGKH